MSSFLLVLTLFCFTCLLAFIKADRISSDNWLTKILFSPPDSNARGVYDCMKLLLAITSNIVPKQIFEENANGSSISNINNDNGSGNPSVSTNCNNSLNILFNKRRCAVLLYLTEICVPRLDELASTRDAYLLLTERATTPSASVSSSAASAATAARNSSFTHYSTTTAGDIFVTEFRQLTTLESSEHSSTGRKQKHHTNSTTTTSSNISTSGPNGIIISNSPYIPYLLIKGNFLG